MNRNSLVLSLILLGFVVLVGSGFLLWREAAQTDEAPEATNGQSSMTRAEAILQAENYQPDPDQVCAMMITEAVHLETGAEYTFPSGCLPAGWEPAPTDTIQN